MKIEILSFIPDYRIRASNVLVQIKIKDYLKLAGKIIDENEFQRRKVISSRLKTTLKEDLKLKCTIPPIVLGVADTKVPEDFNFENFSDRQQVQNFFEEESLIILDGLQRTYVFLELQAEDGNGDWLENNIRCEVFVGMEKLGILYRMLTLNTGQTTMSTRHLLEILYFDYLSIKIEGISLLLDKDDNQINDPAKEFKFKDIIEGYNSFIDGREVPIERADILQNIETIKSLERTSDEKEGFKAFLLLYNSLLVQLKHQSKFAFNEDDVKDTEFELGAAPFGRDIVKIFSRSQAMTGLGAALNHIKRFRGRTITEINEQDVKEICEVQDYSLNILLSTFDFIRNKSKKVGNDQRFFFKSFFVALLDPEKESYRHFAYSVDRAKISVEEKIDSNSK